jgi:hypothetical protein
LVSQVPVKWTPLALLLPPELVPPLVEWVPDEPPVEGELLPVEPELLEPDEPEPELEPDELPLLVEPALPLLPPLEAAPGPWQRPSLPQLCPAGHWPSGQAYW